MFTLIVLWQTLFILVVVSVEAELGLSPVIQCSLSCNLIRNFVEGGVTSASIASCDTLFDGLNSCGTVTSAVSESWDLVLLFAAVEATCLAEICSLYSV